MADVNYTCTRQFSFSGTRTLFGATTGPYTTERVFQWTNYRVTGKSHQDWKALIAKGLYAGTPLDGFKRTLYVNPNGFIRSSLGSYPGDNYSTSGPRILISNGFIPVGGHTSFNSTLKQQAIDQAATNFIKSYRDALTAWHAGTFIGELAETVRFLKSPLKSLERLTIDMGKNIRDLNKRLAKKQIREDQYLRVATDSWLAYKFGAKPLVADAHAAHEALKRFTEHKSLQTVRLIGTGTKSTRALNLISPSKVIWWPGNEFPGDSSVKSEAQEVVTVSCRMLGAFKTSNPSGELPFWDSLGLAPDNWAPTIWEVIPHSFIADYFCNAGAVIDAVSFQLVNVSWVQQTCKQWVHKTCSPMDYVPETATNYAYGSQVVDTHVLVKRERLASVPVPDLKLKLPSLGQSLNLAALLNGIEGLKPPRVS